MDWEMETSPSYFLVHNWKIFPRKMLEQMVKSGRAVAGRNGPYFPLIYYMAIFCSIQRPLIWRTYFPKLNVPSAYPFGYIILFPLVIPSGIFLTFIKLFDII